MTDPENPAKEARKPRLTYGELWRLRGRRLLKAPRYLTILAVALAVVYLVADQIVWRKVIAQRETFAQRFGGSTLEDFVPESVAPTEDAGRLYNMASVYIAKAHAIYDLCDPQYLMYGDPEELARVYDLDEPLTEQESEAMARALLAAAQPGLDLIAQAGELNACRLQPSSIDASAYLGTLAEVRELARWIGAKALVSARDGNPKEGLEWVISGLHLANGLKDEPLLVPQLVRVALTSMALGTAQAVLDAEPGPIVVDKRIRSELAALRDVEPFVRSLAAESRYNCDDLGAIRLYEGLNELKLTAVVMDLVDALQKLEPPARAARLDEINEAACRGSAFLHTLVVIMVPSYTRFASQYDAVVAECNLFDVAVELKNYKARHGAYPESLDEAASEVKKPLPKDPYTGALFHYAREGDGFVLWSLGTSDEGDEPPPEDERFGRYKGRVVWRFSQ